MTWHNIDFRFQCYKSFFSLSLIPGTFFHTNLTEWGSIRCISIRLKYKHNNIKYEDLKYKTKLIVKGMSLDYFD
jgi:hypothetical protein